MKQKSSLTQLYIFWTFICVGIPLLLSIFLLRSAQNEWRNDFTAQIHRSQVDLQLAIEEFFISEWIPDLKKRALDGVNLLEEKIQDVHLKKGQLENSPHWIPFFEEEYFKYLTGIGFRIGSDSKTKTDLASPLRIKLAYSKFNEPTKDYFDLCAKIINFKELLPKIDKVDSVEQKDIIEKGLRLANQFVNWNKTRLLSNTQASYDDLKNHSGYQALMDFIDQKWKKVSKTKFFDTKSFWHEYIVHENHLVQIEQRLGDADWDVFQNLIKPLFKLILLNEVTLEPAMVEFLNQVTGIEPSKLLSEWTYLDVAHERYQARYQPFLADYSQEKYTSGQMPPPQFMVIALIKEYHAALMLARIIDSLQKITTLNDLDAIKRELTAILRNDDLEPSLTVSCIREDHLKELLTMVPRSDIATSKGSLAAVMKAIIEGLFRLFTLSSQTEQTLESNRSQWTNKMKIEIIPSSKISSVLKKLGVQEVDNQPLYHQFSKPTTVKDYSGKSYIISVSDSQRIRGFTFLFTLSDEVARYHEKIQRGIVYLTAMLAILIALLVIGKLSKHMIRPILDLTTQISNLEPGDENFKSPYSCRSDEIGQLSSSFESMNISVGMRIHELETLNRLNMMMLEGCSFEELKTQFIETIRTTMEAEHILISFFDWNHSTVPLSFKHTDNFHSIQRADEFQSLIIKLQIHSRSLDPGVHLLKEESLSLLSENTRLVITRAQTTVSSTAQNAYPSLIVLIGGPVQLDSERESFLMSYAAQFLSLFQQHQLQELLRETEHGSQLQINSMLPKLENLPKNIQMETVFVPARYLGGDFLDATWHPEKKILDMVISDVSGKGMGSALLGTTARTFWKVEAERHQDLASLFHHLNTLICNENFPTLFLTLFQLRINLSTLEYEFASAGHNRMLCLCTQSGQYHELSGKGLPLGMIPDVRYSSQKGKLKTTDLIFLYTDGVTEMEDIDQQLFGFSRLIQSLVRNRSLAPDKLKDTLLHEFDEYRRGAPPSDDFSFMMLGNLT